jgi:NADPH:quinone reductase
MGVMRALYSTPEGSQPLELREADEPTPELDELVIEVKAVSLNRGELMLLPARPGWRPGQDVAGTVVQAAGDDSGPPAGTRVVAVVDQGGWAERVAAPTARVGVLPDTVSFAAGATLGVAGLTALRGLRAGGPLLNSRVLVTGASGGVGHFAVQLANLGGADVTATAGGEERVATLSALGAAHVVVGDEELEGDYDLVMEGVGGPSLERSARALAPGGVVVLYGRADPEPAELSLADFAGAPHSRIQPFFIYQTGVETFGRDLTYMAGLAGQGRLRPEIGMEVSWRDVSAAVEALRDRRVQGKVVLLVD